MKVFYLSPFRLTAFDFIFFLGLMPKYEKNFMDLIINSRNEN